MALADTQFGVFTAAQAAAVGVTPTQLRRRSAIGRLHRLHRGIYSVVSPKLLPGHGHRMAAVLAGGPGAGLSHRAAGVHIGFLPGSAPRVIDVTVPSRHGRRHHDRVRIHRCATLRPGDVVPVYRIPTTTVSRTLVDLAGQLSEAELAVAMDECGRLELLDLNDLDRQIVNNHGRPEAARLAILRERWQYVWSLTESELEKRTLLALAAAGLPQPELQVVLDLGDGLPRIRADFLYREARLILEADSWRWHAQRLEQDAKRDQRAAAAGFQTLRITRRQVVLEADRIAATVASVHAQRCPELSPS